MKLHYSHVTWWRGNWLNCVWWKWIFGFPRSVGTERGKNQHGRLLCSKLEQKLDMEEVEYMHACNSMVDGTEILVLKKVYLTSTLSGQFNYYYWICCFNQYRQLQLQLVELLNFEEIGYRGRTTGTGHSFLVILEYSNIEPRVRSTCILEITFTTSNVVPTCLQY